MNMKGTQKILIHRLFAVLCIMSLLTGAIPAYADTEGDYQTAQSAYFEAQREYNAKKNTLNSLTSSLNKAKEQYNETKALVENGITQEQLNFAETKYQQLQESCESAETEIARLQTVEENSSEAVNKAKKTEENAKVTYQDAQSKSVQAKKDADAANVSGDIASAKTRVAETKAVYEPAKKQYLDGAFGFYEHMGWQHAIDYLENDVIKTKKYVHRGNIHDATSIPNMKFSFQFIRECNKLRRMNGRAELLVDPLYMAFCQANCNWLLWGDNGGHAPDYTTEKMVYDEEGGFSYEVVDFMDGTGAENQAGAKPANSSPFLSWYWHEKENYDHWNATGEWIGEIGHYINVVRNGYHSTGYAAVECVTGDIDNGRADVPGYYMHVQQFDSSNGGLTVDQFEQLFDDYVASIGYDEKKAAYEEAVKELEKIDGTNYQRMQKLYQEALTAEAEAKTAYENAVADRQQKESDYANAKANTADKQGEYETLAEKCRTAYAAYINLKNNYDQYYKDYYPSILAGLEQSIASYTEQIATAQEAYNEAERIYNEAKETYERIRAEYYASLETDPNTFYYLHFDLKGGSYPSGKNPAAYQSSSSDITLKNPIKDGCEFIGWTGTDLEEPQTTVTIKSGSIGERYYIANWKENVTYTISYDTGDGVIEGRYVANYKNALVNDYTLPQVSCSGCEFIGWTGANGDIPQKTVTIPAGTSENLSYKAHYRYGLSYNLDGGSDPGNPTWHNDYETITLMNPTKSGYTFTGWSVGNSTSLSKNLTIQAYDLGQKRFVAHWEKKQTVVPTPEPDPTPAPIEYSITYNLDGGSASNPKKYTSEDSFTLNTPTRKDYTFLGWMGTGISGVAETVTIPEGSSGDRTYTAVWTYVSEALYNGDDEDDDFGLAEMSMTTSLELSVGEEKTINAVYKPVSSKYNNSEYFTWISSDTDIVDVTDGVVRAIKEGTAVVTCKHQLKNVFAKCHVTVKKKSSSEGIGNNGSGANTGNTPSGNHTGGGNSTNTGNSGKTTGTAAKPATTPAKTNTPQKAESYTANAPKVSGAVGEGASHQAAENAVLVSRSEEGPAGSVYNRLQLQEKKVKKTSINIKWKGIAGAKYYIYGSKCKTRMSKIGETNATSFTQKKLKKGTYYKYMVLAVKGGKVVSASKVVHIATSGGKVGNHAKIALSKKKVKIKKGKTVKLKAAVKKGKLKVKKHRGVKWESANPAIAIVSKSGKVKGIKKGKAVIYAYTQNGKCAKCTVTVK